MIQNELLLQSHLFDDFDDDDLARIQSIVIHRECEDGEQVFVLNEPARDLLIVTSGEIHLELPMAILGQTRNVGFETKHPGDVVGWSALVPPYRFTLSARARGSATIAVLPAEKLLEDLEDHPRLGMKLMRNLASIVGERLHHTQKMWSRELQRSLDERYR